MTKTQLKSILKGMEKDDIIKLLLDVYDAKKEAREYLDYRMAPNEKGKLKEYKEIIEEEFFPFGRYDPKIRLSVCRKAISDFKKLNPSVRSIADLMVFYMETACEAANVYGDLWEEFYDSVEGNFEKTLKFLVKNNLVDKFHSRIEHCLELAESSGWGFPDSLNDIYYEVIGR